VPRETASRHLTSQEAIAVARREWRMLAALASMAMLTAMPTICHAGEDLMKCTVTAEFGQDAGQSLGSLFEARTADGSFVLGAGFCDVYNTRHRTDRLVVQFFVRPTDGNRQFSLESLPRPWSATGTYMFNVADQLVATKPSDDTATRVWDATTASWLSREGTAPARVRIDGGTLAFGDGRFWHDGRAVLDAPAQGSYQRFYYAGGHLFFYHVFRGEKNAYRAWESNEDGFSKLYACPWRPSDGTPVDLSRAVVETLPIVGETTFSWGQLDGAAVTCSNIGGVYVFDGTSWRTIREPTLGESFQVYTMVRYYDRLLLGQYPTGEFFEFDGGGLKRLQDWPPRIDGVSASARECQTATVWGGELIAGVWPWGELWRHNADTDRWQPMGRLFSHPAAHADPGHPYQNQCEQLGLVSNQWGQRVTSMVPLGDSLLMISTSAKWPFEPSPAPDFMTEEQLAEYGTVWRMRVPGCLSAPIHWTPEQTELEFIVTADAMQIRQNGLLLAETSMSPELAERIVAAGRIASPEWGTGAYGPFGGASITGAVSMRE